MPERMAGTITRGPPGTTSRMYRVLRRRLTPWARGRMNNERRPFARLSPDHRGLLLPEDMSRAGRPGGGGRGKRVYKSPSDAQGHPRPRGGGSLRISVAA